MKTISFAVRNKSSLHKLELSKTLLHFTEYDFTYFWEQCIEAGRNARKTGRLSPGIVSVAQNAVIKCHPYVEACIQSEFASVVTDCIIAYICHSEGMGLEELWTRCISPKSLYEKAIFTRISEYKTGKGINQWVNIVRMQEYARSKLRFIYENESGEMQSPNIYRTRREYFDLAFSVAANDTGCLSRSLPSVKIYTPALMPEAPFIMGKASKNIYRRLSEALKEAEQAHMYKGDCCDGARDQLALDAFAYVKDMPRPEERDMSFAAEVFEKIPAEIYLPDSFKAVIDLEIAKMDEEGIYLSKCPSCGRYFVRSADEKSPYCSRINKSGKTCAELIEDELAALAGGFTHISDGELGAAHHTADNTDAADNIPAQSSGSSADNSSPQNDMPADNSPAAVDENISENNNTTEENIIPDILNTTDTDDNSDVPVSIPPETERRCQNVYNLVYKRIGQTMTQTEFAEWAGYLSDLKRNIRNGTDDMEQLNGFLAYWENAMRKTKKPKIRSRKLGTAYDGDSLPKTNAGNTDSNVSSGISPAGVEGSTDEVQFKPFNPPRYNTVIEAMADGKYKSDSILHGLDGENETPDSMTVNGKKITLPNWERISDKN